MAYGCRGKTSCSLAVGGFFKQQGSSALPFLSLGGASCFFISVVLVLSLLPFFPLLFRLPALPFLVASPCGLAAPSGLTPSFFVLFLFLPFPVSLLSLPPVPVLSLVLLFPLFSPSFPAVVLFPGLPVARFASPFGLGSSAVPLLPFPVAVLRFFFSLVPVPVPVLSPLALVPSLVVVPALFLSALPFRLSPLPFLVAWVVGSVLPFGVSSLAGLGLLSLYILYS